MAANRCILRHYERGPFQNNVYILEDAELRQAWVIDPSMDSGDLLDEIDKRRLDLKVILNTHAHLDHVFHNRLFSERTGAEIWIHADDLPLLEAVEEQGSMFGIEVSASPPPQRLLRHGDRLHFAGLDFEVLHTPGHTPGGVCLHSAGLLVAGDTLFAGSIGRTDLPGGSYATLIRSIRERLLPLPDATRVLCGHGPETTIGRERGSNPFLLQPEAFGPLG